MGNLYILTSEEQDMVYLGVCPVCHGDLTIGVTQKYMGMVYCHTCNINFIVNLIGRNTDKDV
jgi:hypothetical protein